MSQSDPGQVTKTSNPSLEVLKRIVNMNEIEKISVESRLIAIIIKSEFEPSETQFVTDRDVNMQVGFIKYPADGIISPHFHRPLERNIVGTGEVLYVRSGKLEVSLFDDSKNLASQRILNKGDLLVLISGGHGFRMLEDTVLLEVKQGPYTGMDEKERFAS